MSLRFDCDYLGESVELSDERQAHIIVEHAVLVPFIDRIADVLSEPDVVRRSRKDSRTRLFNRWYDDVISGKHVVVVVVTDQPPQARHWIVTAYVATRAIGGTVEWVKS